MLSMRYIRGTGIDSHHCELVRQPYLLYRPARLHRLAESIPGNGFLGSINVYKYRLRRFLAVADPIYHRLDLQSLFGMSCTHWLR
jgi:hypothetical protein